ncbi:hypothetical protein PybrP1_009752 [[Pythium] brassicae (nom. inval.)]|nr:hypothetical protein PybrP1_009752 [[Pythium] brassicae (nom. inval.)]
MTPRGRSSLSKMPTRAHCSTPLWLLALASLLLLAAAEYSAKDDVVILTDKNFEREVLKSADYWLVEFYAPWCGHCKNLEPEFKAAAKKLKKQARLGAVDATAHQALAQKYGIQGYPTLKEFGANKDKPTDYRGGRTKKDIVQYVTSSEEAKALGVRSVSVPSLEFASVHAFLTQNDKVPSAIFFGAKKSGKKKALGKPPSWLSAVADAFTKGKKKKKPTVQVAFVPAGEGKIAKHFNIDEESLPAVVFVTPAGGKFIVGDMATLDEASAKQFVAKALKLEAAAVERLPSVPLFPAPEVAKKKPKAQLERLDETTMRECLKKSGKMCVVVAKASGDDAGTTFDETLKSLAKIYRRDPFKFLASDTDAAVFKALVGLLGAPESEVVVVKPGKKVKFSTLSSSSNEKSIAQFLDKIIGGSITFAPISTRPHEEL